MRIGLFSEDISDSVNGTATRILRTVRELRRFGDEVAIFAPLTPHTPRGEAAELGVPLIGVPSRPLPLYPSYRLAVAGPATERALRDFDPDVVHLFTPNFLAFSALRLARRCGVPVVASFETHVPAYLSFYGLPWLERPLWALLRGVHNRADASLTISTPAMADLMSHGLRRVGLWRGAVDAERFHPGRRAAAARARLSGGEPERPLLLYVGRLAAEKQVALLRGLLEAVPEARLALVGDGPHRPALERHFAGTPTLFTGPLYGADLAAAYASADLFVFPSATETFGLVLLEAMASGLPVVAAAAGGVTDFVRSGEVGFLFTPGDAAGLASAARAVLDAPDLRAHLAANARREAERWSWARSTAELRATYRRVVDRPNVPLPAWAA